MILVSPNASADLLYKFQSYYTTCNFPDDKEFVLGYNSLFRDRKELLHSMPDTIDFVVLPLHSSYTVVKDYFHWDSISQQILNKAYNDLIAVSSSLYRLRMLQSLETFTKGRKPHSVIWKADSSLSTKQHL